MELLTPSQEKIDLINLISSAPQMYPTLPSHHPIGFNNSAVVEQEQLAKLIKEQPLPLRHRHLSSDQVDKISMDMIKKKTADKDHMHSNKLVHTKIDEDLLLIETGDESLINADQETINLNVNMHDEDAVEERKNHKHIKENLENAELIDERIKPHKHLDKDLETTEDRKKANARKSHKHINKNLENLEEFKKENPEIIEKGRKDSGNVSIENATESLFANEIRSTKTTVTLRFRTTGLSQYTAL